MGIAIDSNTACKGDENIGIAIILSPTLVPIADISASKSSVATIPIDNLGEDRAELDCE